MMELGLDPDRDGTGKPVRRQTRSLEEYKRFFAFPARAHAHRSEVTASDVAGMDDAQLEETIRMYVANQRVIQDPAVIQAIEQRRGEFQLETTAQQDKVVDGTTYEVTGSVYFATVTLKNGGSIRINSAGYFECDDFIREQSDTPAQYDISYVGPPGASPSPVEPDPAEKGADGKNGSDGECVPGGGWAAHGATDGARGQDGAPGGDAAAGTDAQPFGSTYFTINNSLTGYLSFSNQGGVGGNGGAGGQGGQGGDGGDGGDGKQCQQDTANGGHGGNGGTGGRGGNGSDGGDGGEGATLYIAVPAGAKIAAVNLAAPGGAKGARGLGGVGGQGGKGGSHGGGDGHAGTTGADGNEGTPGNAGRNGTIFVNDQFFA
jgi:hypothetical protein